ncbi:mpv17-like protein [Hyposmocoma kahamanoa]|uniref:mpv17-like protein n=1 Tax=Hyposmocoma kahamanoa TaxID=1477025 RepID=UPI000E6D8B92|nr:mpv17-like protein [Hyposmocoma kahamanoa]
MAPISYNLIRGMVSYAIIWPASSVTEEYLLHGTTPDNADWARAARFGFFGAFFMSPLFYNWMRLNDRLFPKKDLVTALKRSALEACTYAPLAMSYFFFGMCMLEGKPYEACVIELKEKLWPTYKLGLVYWPTVQTINFYFVSPKNRIIFVSIASFVWTVYMCHVKAKLTNKSDS